MSDDIERMRHDLDGDDGSPPPLWNPKPGETLIGYVERYDDRSTRFGPCRVAVVRDSADDEMVWSVFLQRNVLKNEFERQEPRPGDLVGIKYHGQKTTRGENPTEYHNYSLRVSRTGSDASSTPPLPQQPLPPQSSADDDDEELPE